MSRNTDPTGTADTFEAGEFVEIEYTARIAGDGTVVDTTDPAVAADSGIEGVDAGGPAVVVLGEGHVFDPVEDAITGMCPGERRTVEVSPAGAFGEPDPTRRVSIPLAAFSGASIEQNDRITVDGQVGHVDAVDEGTATVDFNHPLAGSALEYEIRTIDRVVGTGARVDGLLRLYGLGDDVECDVHDGVVACSATRSSVPAEEWYGRKRQFLDAATGLLDVDGINFEERYPID